MAGCIMTASCGCTSATAISCSEPGCRRSACVECACEGWEETFIGEGPLGAPPNAIDAPLELPGEGFLVCEGTSADGVECTHWLCSLHREDGVWNDCIECCTYYCPDCYESMPHCDAENCENQWVCEACDEEGRYNCCCKCDEHQCDDCFEGLYCEADDCPRVYCSDCTEDDSVIRTCDKCEVSLCTGCQLGPYVTCWSCETTTCAPCAAKAGKKAAACGKCERTFCGATSCQDHLVGCCSTCHTKFCESCTCARCDATLCAACTPAGGFSSCPVCQDQCCQGCLMEAECCSRSMCATCAAQGSCKACGLSLCASCSAQGAHAGCNPATGKRSKTR